MKWVSRRVLWLLLFSACIWIGCGKGATDEAGKATSAAKKRQEGERIISEYLKRDSSPYRKSFIRFSIKLPNQTEEVYDLEVWRRQTSEQTDTLTQVSRNNEGGLASLTIERNGQDTVNVSYVPANDQFRETGTNRTFFGGLTMGELLGEWQKYDSDLVAEKEVDGSRAYEVESKLKPSAESAITRFTTLFRSDNYLPIESHLFNSRDEEIRTYYVRDHRTIEGRPVVWTTEIENHANNGKIRIEMTNVSFPAKLDDAAFTREKVKALTKP